VASGVRALILALLVTAMLAAGALGKSSPITGFGATDAAWNRAHQADHVFAPGAAYDPDPSLPKVNGHTGDHYYAVIHENGHVLAYGYRFRPQSMASVKALVLRTEFPTDARVVWFISRVGNCALMLVQSSTLAHALGGKAIGDKKGTALVEFSSGVDEDTYSPRSVNDANLSLWDLTPKSGAPAC
jgi:hypothetical protein